MIKVEGNSDYARCEKTGAIININSSEIEAARARKTARKLQKEKDKQLHDDVEMLKAEIGDIKNLLTQLVEKL